jgi:5-(carboxyamino)imidazole ribonucleotide mutase
MGNMSSENERQDSGESEEQRLSKSARKREAASLQELGVKLSALPDQEIKALDLPENLFIALRDLRRLPSHGAQVRQRQYIGKLMRNIDPEPVLAKMAERKQRHDLEIRHFQQIERWRDRLLSEPTAAMDELLEEYPKADRAALTRLLDKAEKERAEQRSPVGARELFAFCASCSDRLVNLATMKAVVGVIMGSSSDWETMQAAADTLTRLGIAHEVRVISAHRTPDLLFEYAASARERGLKAIIAGAGGAAHLPGMTAAKTSVPVLGVPIQSKALSGIDSFLSIAQMPSGVPVATFAIGVAGAANAALFAAAMLANEDAGIRSTLDAFRQAQTAAVLAKPDPRHS